VRHITGAHALKFGATHRSGWIDFYTFDFQPLTYRFNNGVPNPSAACLPSLAKRRSITISGVFARTALRRANDRRTHGVR
jgi:hypothetical protein